MYGYAFISMPGIKTLAKLVRYIEFPVENFTDKRFFPLENEEPELVARYFIVMVAMDHRLSRPGKPYEAVIDGKHYHGADLLYRLGMKKLYEDPGFFDPTRLSKVRERDIEDWLSTGSSRPPDARIRAMLLRDIGYKLLKLYDGKVLSLISAARNRLKTGLHNGFIDRLRSFIAYNDPVEKKAHLLAKFLERRRLLRVNDSNNKHVPVDNHVTRLALRWGIVVVKGTWLAKIKKKQVFTHDEDIMLRLVIREAYKRLCGLSSMDPYILDDFLWSFGRKCCRREEPVCINECHESCSKVGGCRNNACILSGVCQAFSKKVFLPEHSYYDTWYY